MFPLDLEQHASKARVTLDTGRRCFISLSKQGHVELQPVRERAATRPSADIGPALFGPFFCIRELAPSMPVGLALQPGRLRG